MQGEELLVFQKRAKLKHVDEAKTRDVIYAGIGLDGSYRFVRFDDNGELRLHRILNFSDRVVTPGTYPLVTYSASLGGSNGMEYSVSEEAKKNYKKLLKSAGLLPSRDARAAQEVAAGATRKKSKRCR